MPAVAANMVGIGNLMRSVASGDFQIRDEHGASAYVRRHDGRKSDEHPDQTRFSFHIETSWRSKSIRMRAKPVVELLSSRHGRTHSWLGRRGELLRTENQPKGAESKAKNYLRTGDAWRLEGRGVGDKGRAFGSKSFAAGTRV